MTHNRSPKKVVFTPNDVEITEMSNGRVIEKCFLGHNSRVYKFSHFMPLSNPYALLINANYSRNLWNAMFGYLNYKYIYNFGDKYMFIGFPKIMFSKGV